MWLGLALQRRFSWQLGHLIQLLAFVIETPKRFFCPKLLSASLCPFWQHFLLWWGFEGSAVWFHFHSAFFLFHGLNPKWGRIPLGPLVQAVAFTLFFFTHHLSRAHGWGRRSSAAQQVKPEMKLCLMPHPTTHWYLCVVVFKVLLLSRAKVVAKGVSLFPLCLSFYDVMFLLMCFFYDILCYIDHRVA